MTRLILQLGLLLLLFLGATSRVWGRAVAWRHDATPTTASPVVHTFQGPAYVLCPGAPPSATGPRGTTTPPWVLDGPNVYAYVQQNPWTGFDAHGLAGSFGVEINGCHYGICNRYEAGNILSAFEFGTPMGESRSSAPVLGTWDVGVDQLKANVKDDVSKPLSYVKGFLFGESDGTRAGDTGQRNSDALALMSLGRNVPRSSGGSAQPMMVTPNGQMVPAPAAAMPAAGAPAIVPSVLFNQNNQSGGSPENSQKEQAGQNEAVVKNTTPRRPTQAQKDAALERSRGADGQEKCTYCEKALDRQENPTQWKSIMLNHTPKGGNG